MNNELFKLADELKNTKEQKKELDNQSKVLGETIEELDRKLSDAMAEAECDRFSRNGNTFYLTSRLYASPAQGQKAALIDALKHMGYSNIVTETVSANTLASFVKEQRTENAEEIPVWLKDVVNTYEKVSVGIRKG